MFIGNELIPLCEGVWDTFVVIYKQKLLHNVASDVAISNFFLEGNTLLLNKYSRQKTVPIQIAR